MMSKTQFLFFALNAPVLQCYANNLGKWSDIIKFPVIPVAGFIVPEFPESNKLMVYSAQNDTAYRYPGREDQLHRTQYALFDYSTGEVSHRTVANTHHDMFCPGMSILTDGRVLITGGADNLESTFYDVSTDSFTSGPKMTLARGYQSQTTLSNGDVFVIGGSWGAPLLVNGTYVPGAGPLAGNRNGELYCSKTNSFRALPGAEVAPILTSDSQGPYAADNHAWLFAWKDSTVFHAGPSKAMHWFTTTGDGAVQPAGIRDAEVDAMNGAHVMYEPGKIFSAGGSIEYEGAAAHGHAHLITIDQPYGEPAVERLPDLHHARTYTNVVVLPDGKMLVTGGQASGLSFRDEGWVSEPELFDPVTKTFTLLAEENVPRVYHSMSLLLADGRVFSAGSGLCEYSQYMDGLCTGEFDHPDAQIFSPPYLFTSNGTEATRPIIAKISATHVSPGDELEVTIEGKNTQGMQFSLIRMGSVTHTVNSDQRRIPLDPAQSDASSNKFSLGLPGDAGIVIPGPYFLFAVSADGVPSIAKTIMVEL